MNALLATLILPTEISDFERRYLARMNRIGLGFFAMHVPALALVAGLNGTGIGLAIALSLAVMVGPALAYRVFSNPRAMSLTYGVTSMLMGGLLVHFGQGPLQIEMHFYFFAVLAMLVLFANPMSIVVAAATVALHHLALWIVVPSSVFNYDAPVWVVGVHAAFVVLESIAACFIARSFFDNVIGLEKIVQVRTAELADRNAAMRLVLDNVRHGLLMLDRDGVVARERSSLVDAWVGAIGADVRFSSVLRRSDPDVADWFDVSWVEVRAGIMPLELTLAQLPTRFTSGTRRLELDYVAISPVEGELDKVLVVVSDVTVVEERERLESQQRELVALLNRLSSDRRGVLEFLDEGTALVSMLAHPSPSELSVVRRGLHTLKGNAGIFGVGSVATLCHELETRVDETNAHLSAESRQALADRWDALRKNLRPLLGESRSARVEIGEEDLERIVSGVKAGRPTDEIARELESWLFEPTAVRLGRIADQARRIAERLGRPELVVDIADHGVRLRPERWTSFWASFVHVVRNAVDHGIEPAATRRARGKPERGRIELATSIDGPDFVVSIEDDGEGIDIARLAAAAERLGLDPKGTDEILDTLFHDGVTTSGSANELSGRGIGMGAVRAECIELGGRVVTTSVSGRGTRFEFRFPVSSLDWAPQLRAA